MDRVKVILLYSLAYSGTTWLNLVLGSGRDILCLGAGDRLFKDGPSQPEAMCLVHPDKCDFWPSFFRHYNSAENFFVQLREHTGISTFVLNNPSIKLYNEQFTDDRLDVRVIEQVRDGRPTLASAMRHHPERVANVYQSAVVWLYRGTVNLKRRVANTGKTPMLLRYEDAVIDPHAMLAEAAEHTGYPYTAESLEYWNYEHHLPGANRGALDILMRMQGGAGLDHDRKDYYDELMTRLRETKGVPKLDDSWLKAYSDVDMAAYDFAAGALYEDYGYPRPEIGEAARREFIATYDPPATPEEALKTLPPWRQPAHAAEPGMTAAAPGQGVASRAFKRLGSFISRRMPS